MKIKLKMALYQSRNALQLKAIYVTILYLKSEDDKSKTLYLVNFFQDHVMTSYQANWCLLSWHLFSLLSQLICDANEPHSVSVSPADIHTSPAWLWL